MHICLRSPHRSTRTARPFAAALAAAPLLTMGAAHAEPNFEMYVPEGFEAFTEEYKAAPIVRAGDFVYISGIVAGLPPDVEPSTDLYEQGIRAAFERISDTLAAAGASWSEVVEMTTFHVGMRDHQNIFVDVRGEFIVDPPYPAWTAIGVEKLWADGLFAEIRVVAYLGD